MTPPKSRPPVRIRRPRVMFPLLFLAAGLALAPRCFGDTAQFENTGSLVQGRSYHTSTLLPDGKVLVVGGYTPNNDAPPADLATAEQYDPAPGPWLLPGSLTNRRSSHTATLLPDG